MFSRVLVANRGEIACRIIATCRRLGIYSIAVYSEADANAPHVKSADEAVCLGPPPVVDSYLNQSAILRAIEHTRADALHPGYGFFSESAKFAAAVATTGCRFIGPSPAALAFLSDKIRARERATQLGLPPVPGVSHSIHDGAPADWLELARNLGWPLLVKAAGAGGGIGMKLVRSDDELISAVQAAAVSAQRSFGDCRVYLERYLECAHHVELQLLRSSTGHFVTLGSRECSIQRRFQKLIEECPSPTFSRLSQRRQEQVFAFAKALLASVDYVGVATLETLIDGDGNVFFLEVNARLQVEHTVTEQVFGVDLVEEQLRMAALEDVSESLRLAVPRGHAIEARIYAESPTRKFAPQPGLVERLHFPAADGLRVDCGIQQGSQVSPYYDPLLAKVIAWAPGRGEATEKLLAALGETEILVVGKQGPRDNNVQLLRQLMGLPEWVSADYDTRSVERLFTANLDRALNEPLAARAPDGG